MAVVLKKGGGVMLVGGQEVRQEKIVIDVVVDGVLHTDGSTWFLTDVEMDPQKMKKSGFVDGDKVKLTIKAVRKVV